MNTHKPPPPLDGVSRLCRLGHGRRPRRRLRYGLRTLLLIVTAVCVLVRPANFLLTRLLLVLMDERWSVIKAMPVADAMLVPFVVCGALIGAPVFAWIRRLHATTGFLISSALTCLGLLALVAAFSLDTAPLTETELQHLSVGQIVRIGLLFVAVVPSVSAFLGWYWANLEGE